MIELEATGRKLSGNRIVTDAPYILIGRSPASNLIYPDPRVSWHHGEVVYRDKQYFYFDLRSTHGSVLRRDSVDRPVQAVRLKAGDTILLAGDENAVRVRHLAQDEFTRDDVAITISGELGRQGAIAEDLFIDDAAALRSFLALERALARGDESGRTGMLQSLLECLKGLYPELDYAAVLEERNAEILLSQSLSLSNRAFPRKSTRICTRAKESRDGITFEVSGAKLFEAHADTPQKLSDVSATIEHDTTGICVPLRIDKGTAFFVQVERAATHERFSNRDLVLVRAMVFRTEDRIRHLDITQRYNAASQNAALGIFAQTLAHDIKNALTFAPYMKEKLADPARHADVVRGVETAYQLARCLQSPSRSDARTMGEYSLARLADTVVGTFSSLFEDRCRFESVCESGREKIVGYGHLLYRTVWNLVINAYNAHENNERTPRGERYIRLCIGNDPDGSAQISIEDNAGGMHPEVLVFFQHAFAMIKDACDRETDILQVVEMMKREEGAVNRVGLFFTAIAVYDMDGRIEVHSQDGAGTRFTITLPERIEKLKGLLQF